MQREFSLQFVTQPAEFLEEFSFHRSPLLYRQQQRSAAIQNQLLDVICLYEQMPVIELCAHSSTLC